MDALLDTADLVKDEDLVGNGDGGERPINPAKNPTRGRSAKQRTPGELQSETGATEPADAAGACRTTI